MGDQHGDLSLPDLMVALTYRVRMKEAPENLQEVGRDPTMWDLTGYIKGFGFYPKYNEKPLKGFKQENDIIRFAFLKYHFESCVDERFE